MGVGAAIAAVSLAVSAASAYKQQQAAQEAADERKEAQEKQLAQGQNRQNQQRRQQIREERIRRARILQASQNTGVGASSSQTGSLGALGTQTGANIAFMQSETQANRGISSNNQAALDARTKGELWSGIGQISGTVFGAAGGFNAFQGGGQSQGTGAPTNFMDETFTF